LQEMTRRVYIREGKSISQGKADRPTDSLGGPFLNVGKLGQADTVKRRVLGREPVYGEQ